MPTGNQTNSTGRGGARKGAGRPKGAETRKTRLIAEKAAAEGISPLEFMLQVMRTPVSRSLQGSALVAATTLRFEAAKAAAPYVHPRLQAIEHSGGIAVKSLAEELAGLNAVGNAEGSPPLA